MKIYAPFTGLVLIPKGLHFGFKAVPSLAFELPGYGMDPSPDWKAFYPQLTFESALDYLPNQWDRGYTQAHIVKLVANRDIEVIVLADEIFLDGQTDSSVKADHARTRINEFLTAQNRKVLDPGKSLMQAMEALQLGLVVPDAEGLEFAIPHGLCTGEWMNFEKIFTFIKSDLLPSVKQVVEVDLGRTTLSNHELMKKELRLHVQPCDEMTRLLKESIKTVSW
eukprot:jgi/Mesvir1/23920/Mv10697-RA.1